MSEWQPISEAPPQARVMVCGWQKRSGKTAGYWWYHEDQTFGRGELCEHPDALFFVNLDKLLPPFPEPPK